MAENKKSFVLYTDTQGLINQLPDDVAGRLFKHIYAYVNDENPIADELLLNIAFEPIKMQLKRDLVKYEKKREQWSEAGKKSAEQRALIKFNELQRNPTNVKSVATVSTVNVNDNVNVNVINKIEARSQIFKDSLLKYKDKHQVNMLKEFYNYWTEPNQSKTKMRFELEKTWSLDRRLETWAKRENSFNVKPQIKQDRL